MNSKMKNALLMGKKKHMNNREQISVNIMIDGMNVLILNCYAHKEWK